MSIEIKLEDRIATVELLEQNENLLKLKVDDRIYDVDLMHNDEGAFSIIESGKSYNIELVPTNKMKHYIAYTLYNTYDVEIIDAESRYLRNRGAGTLAAKGNNVISPMPGKVVRIPVNVGDTVKKGDTVIIISAMKMESEYKAPVDGVISKINVSEAETVDSNQVLIEIE